MRKRPTVPEILASRARFWSSCTATVTLLMILIDTEAAGLGSMPLSLMEAAAGFLIGVVTVCSAEGVTASSWTWTGCTLAVGATALDATLWGLATLPLSAAEMFGGFIFGAISLLSARPSPPRLRESARPAVPGAGLVPFRPPRPLSNTSVSPRTKQQL